MKVVVLFFVLWICTLVNTSPLPSAMEEKVVDSPLTNENSASEDLLDTAESSNPRPCGRNGCGGGHRQHRRQHYVVVGCGGGGCGGGGGGGHGGCGGGGCGGGCRYGK